MHTLRVAVVLALMTTHAQAQQMDVSQPLFSAQPYAASTIGRPLSQQSFIPLGETIIGGGFYWQNGAFAVVPGATWPLTESIVEISLGMTLAAVGPYLYSPAVAPQTLATQQVTFTVGEYFGGWVDAFWGPIPVTPGATYFLGIRPLQSPMGAGPGFRSDSPNARVYADGVAYVNGTWMDWHPPNGTTYDFAFRTWTTEQPSFARIASVSTPEPSTWGMMSMGLLATLAVLTMRRRRR